MQYSLMSAVCDAGDIVAWELDARRVAGRTAARCATCPPALTPSYTDHRAEGRDRGSIFQTRHSQSIRTSRGRRMLFAPAAHARIGRLC